MADAPAIVVDDVSKRFRLYRERAGSIKEAVTKARFSRYEELWALRNVSFEVQPGQVYGLVGHNGSGKSSLLRLIAGIQRPTSGTVTTNGRISALLELGAGFHPELTGRENIYLNASILGISRKETDRIYDNIVDFSGLREFVDSPVKHYSSGMFVRLGFAVAVHVNPQILIVDEVIAVGDEEFQRRCFEHLYRLRNRGVTILVVTHSLGLVRSMCDRAAWLDHGHLRVEGTAGEVVNAYLAEVNEAEADRLDQADEEARAAAEAADAAGEGDDTLHSATMPVSRRPIVIDRVEFIGADGQPSPVATTFDPVTVRLHYDCREPVEGPLFSFSVETSGHYYLANPGMRPTHRSEAVLSGRGWIDYTIPSLPLGPGEYTISAAVHDKDAMVCFDKKDRLTSLRVQPGDPPVYASVDLLGQWQAPSPEDSR